MELEDLKNIWQEDDARIEKKLNINDKIIELFQRQKTESALRPLYMSRVIELICHSAAIIFLVWFLLYNITQLPYALSAVALLFFYGAALINAYLQIRLINSMDYTKDIATLQSKLVLLQTHILNYARISVLFIPAFLAYPVIATKLVKDFDLTIFGDFDIIAASNGNWWTVQVITTCVLIPLGSWFYREMSVNNMHKKWVRHFIQRSSGRRITKALDFLNELQSLKNDKRQ